MATPLESLRQRRAQKAAEMQALVASVQASDRVMNDDENKQFVAFDDEIKTIDTSISAFERSEEISNRLAQPGPRTVPPVDSASSTEHPRSGATTSTPITGAVVAHRYANHGFDKGIGEFLLKVREAPITGRVDPRLLVNAVTTWAGEQVGADGGFALPPQFTQGIMSQVTAKSSFVQALNPYPTESDLLVIPTDEDAPWSTSAITAAKTAEGAAITASKAVVKQVKVPLHGIKSLVHVDEKALRNMSFLGAYVERKMGEKIKWKVENYVLNGTGENEPLGILNSAALISLTDIDSDATTIGAKDIFAMLATALEGTNAFWIAHPTTMPSIWGMRSGTTGFPLFVQDATKGPGGTLMGLPIYRSEAAKALNTAGDLTLVVPDGYFLVFEQGGVQNATTVAFAFDQNLQSFRSTLYMGGAPALSTKVLRADGANYASHFVTIAGSRT